MLSYLLIGIQLCGTTSWCLQLIIIHSESNRKLYTISRESVKWLYICISIPMTTTNGTSKVALYSETYL